MANQDNEQPVAAVLALGRYQLIRRIGRGGMSEVWLAEDPQLNRQVAIKTLPPHNQNDHEFSLRFEREAQAAAALNHPHILHVHDYGRQQLINGMVVTYIVMPYIAGGSLEDKIARYASANSIMPVQEALNYLSQAAEAIDYAHGQGIVHRDIKPGNMLLRDENWLMLVDFGIARMLADREQLTQAGVSFGTPEYMAPEQAQGRALAASDIYSLGVLAYQLFTGRLPFQADTGYVTTFQHLTMLPPPPRQINPNISPAVEVVLLRCLVKQPAERYSSCRILVGELQRALSDAPYEGTYIQPMIPQTNPPNATTVQNGQQEQMYSESSSRAPNAGKGSITRRQALVAGAATAVVMLGGGLAVWGAIQSKQPQLPGPHVTATAASQSTSQPSSSNIPLVIQGKHDKPVATLAFSPAGNGILASAGDQDDGLVYLWDVPNLFQQKGQQLQEKASLRTQNVTAMLLTWSPQGDMLAIGNAGNSNISDAPITVYKSDLSGYAPGFDDKFGVHGATSIEGLSWAPSQYIYAVIHPFDLNKVNLNAQDQLYMWDPAQPQKAFSPMALPDIFKSADSNTVNISNQNYVYLATNPLQPAPYDTTLLAMGTDKGILIGKVMQGNKREWSKQYTLTFNPDNQYAQTDVGAISWSHSGMLLAAIPDGLQEPNSVTVFDLQKQTLTTLDQPVDNQSSLTSMLWCPKAASTFVAAGTKDGRVYIWDYQGGKLPQNTLNTPQGVMGVIKALAWSPDGHWLAAAYSDANATIAIWKL
jgi:serine/threonine protein kinase